MTLDELNIQYASDSKINYLDLQEEASQVPLLHAKYVAFWTTERRALLKHLNDYKRLKLEKFVFYSQGPSDESRAKGWEFPAGLILKNNIPMHIDADKDVIDSNTKVEIAQMKVDALEKMVNTLSFRSNLLKLIFDVERWKGGG